MGKEQAPPGSPAEARPTGALAAFRELLDDTRRAVDARLEALFGEKLALARRLGPDVEVLCRSVADLTLRGGKRQRAALLRSAFVACGGEGREASLVEAGASLELLQTYLLIHDDWMDGDEVRRGGPSVHALLAAHFGSRETGERAGVLAGDYASALSQECLALATAGLSQASELARNFAAMQQDVIFGQQLDLLGRSEDVEAMHALKTGSYTARGPILLGARFAGAQGGAIEALEAFAAPLGVAFQLRDDLLGAFGLASETGKPFGSDLRAGKRTALVAEASGLLDAPGRGALARVLGRPGATDDEVRAATALLEGCGARASVERRLDALLASARGALLSPALTPRGALLLEGAALAMTARRA